jgi:hypothetical protein
MPKPEYVIDGARLSTLDEFFDELARVVIPEVPPTECGRGLDAFNDILRGGFGTPEVGGFVIRWKNSALSRERLGYTETARQLEMQLERCHPGHKANLARQIADARRGSGPTVFQLLCEIIATHARGGAEAEDQVELLLD